MPWRPGCLLLLWLGTWFAVSVTGQVCNTGLSNDTIRAEKVVPPCPVRLPPGLEITSKTAQLAYSTVTVTFNQYEDPWHTMLTPAQQRLGLPFPSTDPESVAASPGRSDLDSMGDLTKEEFAAAVFEDPDYELFGSPELVSADLAPVLRLLMAFNVAKPPTLEALVSIQYFELFERWVLEARSPEDLEYVLLPELVKAPGVKLVIRNSFIRNIEPIVVNQTDNVVLTTTPYLYKTGDNRKLLQKSNDPYLEVDSQPALALIEAYNVNKTGAWAYTRGSKKIVAALVGPAADIQHRDLRTNSWFNTWECPRDFRTDTRPEAIISKTDAINETDGYITNPLRRPDAGDFVDQNKDGIVADCLGYAQFNLGAAGPLAVVNRRGEDPVGTDMIDVGTGTHIAGVIGSVGNDEYGTSGASQRVTLMLLKVVNDTLPDDNYGVATAAVEAWAYAERNGARLIHNSWVSVGGAKKDSLEAIAISHTFLKPLQRLARAGIVSVFPAGDDGVDLTKGGSMYPMALNTPLKLVVANTDFQDKLHSKSNYGRDVVDLTAPGTNIWSTVPLEGDKYGYRFYANYTGTNQAAAHVTGVAALCLDALVETCGATEALVTSWAGEVVYECITANTDTVPKLSKFTRYGGRLNARKAVECCSNACVFSS